MDQLYCLALVHRRDLPCLRALDAEALPLLENVRDKGCKVGRRETKGPVDVPLEGCWVLGAGGWRLGHWVTGEGFQGDEGVCGGLEGRCAGVEW